MYGDAWVPHGRSLMDYFRGDTSATIVILSDLGEREELSVRAWFREPLEFGSTERAALDLCRGRVLDAGAGTGCHSLALQGRGLEVCAIDFVPVAVEIMRRRGVREVRQADIFDLEAEPFDTILMFANGAGIAETLAGLDRLLNQLRRLLAPDGQVLLDSTDVRPQAEPGSVRGREREDGRYVGEIQFQLEYRGEKAPPFAQLYVDPETLAERAAAAGWRCRIVGHGDRGHYLAQLTPRPPTQ